MTVEETMKSYIIITEFGDALHLMGDGLPDEVIEAADAGIYDVIDVTDPMKPLRLGENYWNSLDKL